MEGGNGFLCCVCWWCLCVTTVCFTGCSGEGDPHRRVERSTGEQPRDGLRWHPWAVPWPDEALRDGGPRPRDELYFHGADCGAFFLHCLFHGSRGCWEGVAWLCLSQSSCGSLAGWFCGPWLQQSGGFHHPIATKSEVFSQFLVWHTQLFTWLLQCFCCLAPIVIAASPFCVVSAIEPP